MALKRHTMRLMLPGAWLSESCGMTLQDDGSEFSAFNELKIQITDILMIFFKKRFHPRVWEWFWRIVFTSPIAWCSTSGPGGGVSASFMLEKENFRLLRSFTVSVPFRLFWPKMSKMFSGWFFLYVTLIILVHTIPINWWPPVCKFEFVCLSFCSLAK